MGLQDRVRQGAQPRCGGHEPGTSRRGGKGALRMYEEHQREAGIPDGPEKSMLP